MHAMVRVLRIFCRFHSLNMPPGPGGDFASTSESVIDLHIIRIATQSKMNDKNVSNQ